jgi:hypothetical protein
MARSKSRQSTLETRSNSIEFEEFKIGDQVKSSHPMFPDVGGTISALPSPDAAIVEFAEGARERIETKYLQPFYLQPSPIPFQTSENVPVGTSLECEVILPLTQIEAQALVLEINQCANRIRQLLVELELRQGYLSLGFANMSGLMNSELFDKARSSLQKELVAGRIENQYLDVPIGTFPQRHFRPLSKLNPQYYKLAFEQAAEIAGSNGSVTENNILLAVDAILDATPEARKKGIVERLKEKPLYKASDVCSVGDVFTLTKLEGEERKYNGYPCVAVELKHFTINVDVYDTTLTVKPENLKKIDSPDISRQLPATLKRIKQLRNLEQIDRGEEAVLAHLGRQVYLTDFEDKLLAFMEKEHGIESK